MRSHSVTCHPAEVTFPPLSQPKLVLDLATLEGCKAELTWGDVPVMSASCERCHSKVAFVKSAVRASMTSHGLSDLVMISCEKSIIDGMDLPHVVDRFALVPRGLPL